MSGRARWALSVLALTFVLRPAAAQRPALGGTLSFVDHRVDAGFGVEHQAGLVAGGVLTGGVAGLDLEVHARTGRLRLGSPTGADLDMAELGAAASWWPRSWIGARGSLVVRGYSADVARQRWTIVSLGPDVRVPFAAGRVHAVLRGAWLPVVSVSGLSRPSTAFTTSAGTEYDVSRFSFAILYELERYDFPPGTGLARFEQTTALTLQAMFHPGR